ncbi:cyclin-dependent kinase inhibitor 3-like isoform X1 [Lethenteron reissneri]|uniref:cyclin-dependent kinase inhibitor 3-like isoform X1 n=1 Tax=Lethenteron reissneri TaxID=7753 RepID=UPI002AB7290B|nr:cyclin-dependent kinase inhibitor 3-like isoform X1 [Lethenteron reissneri]XP_061437849.1 cyclin-dependent kinase inhibitor 3-like isoform X1 [Lethenteron reissneri]
MSEFNSSDEEVDPAQSDQPPFRIDWLDLSIVGYPTLSLGISSLPGCKFKETWRNLDKDLDEVQSQGVQDVLVLCTPGELVHCRVPDLLEAYARRGLRVHHEPVLDGAVPDVAQCCALLDTMHGSLGAGRRVLVHCYGGLGRSCLLAACFLLRISESLSPEDAIAALRELRGRAAIQTLQQYNFLHDFRELLEAHVTARMEQAESRAVSR